MHEDLKPSDILTREAFENAIVANSAIGGSTNAPIHINAIARHVGVELSIEDWETIGYDVPLLVNMQPAGEYLGEEYYRAGGLPAVMNELLRGRAHPRRRAHHQRQDHRRECRSAPRRRTPTSSGPMRKPLKTQAGFKVLQRQPVQFRDHEDERDLRGIPRALSLQSERSERVRGPRRGVRRTGGLSPPHRRSRRSRSTSTRMLFMRGVGPIGYPGSAEVVNMQPPAALIKRGITSLPCIGDGRQSGTSGSPSILNASPEAAAGGGLALLQTGDRVRIDLNKGTADILISDGGAGASAAPRCNKHGGYHYPASQTPWQEIQRAMVDQLADGMVLKPAVKYQRVAQKSVPRDNH